MRETSPPTDVRASRRRLRNESGQATIEFAFVLPLLTAVILALVDFGLAMNAWLDMTHLANMGSRLAAVNNVAPGNCSNGSVPSPNTLAAYILCNAETKGLQSGGTTFMSSAATVTICFPNGSGNIGDPVKVVITSNYNVVPFTGLTFPLKASSTMRLEQATSLPITACP